MTDQQETQKPTSYMVIRFSEPGSVVFETHFEGVTPYQLLAAASYLEVVGKNELLKLLNDKAEQEASMSLSKPTPKIMVAGK